MIIHPKQPGAGPTAARLVALLVAIGLMASACRSSNDDSSAPTADEAGQSDGADQAGQSDGAASPGRESPPDEPAQAESGPGDPDGAPDPPFPAAAAIWEDCGDGFECADVEVPLDYADPSAARITIALIRVPATGTAQGSILVNPGGPGASGVDFVRGGFRLDPETMTNHHLVGFDPRGIGQSDPLTCNLPPIDGPSADLSPDGPAEAEELEVESTEAADRCQQLDGDLLPHLSTNDVILDLDVVRHAIGDDHLFYVGFSYGTYIGLRYAETFPERVGRMVLDGVVDPSLTLADLLAQQAIGFDSAFSAMNDACQRDLDCPDGGIFAAYDRVMARLEQGAQTAGDRSVGPTELTVASLIALYDEDFWPIYADALDQADGGRYDTIRALYDFYQDAGDRAAYLAVVCSDTPVPDGPAGWDGLATELEALSARFGVALANEVRPCAHWPVQATAAPEPITDGLAVPPILVMTTTGDPATAAENAIMVASALDGSGLVTVDSTDHTAYGFNLCVDRIVADYLATGRVPEAVHRC